MTNATLRSLTSSLNPSKCLLSGLPLQIPYEHIMFQHSVRFVEKICSLGFVISRIHVTFDLESLTIHGAMQIQKPFEADF